MDKFFDENIIYFDIERQDNELQTNKSENSTSSSKKLQKSKQQIINIELFLSWVMRISISVAALIMIVGFILLIINYSDNFEGLTNIDYFTIAEGIINFNPYAIMMLGLFVLILTPIFRVISSIIIFAIKKDKLYVAITIFVLFLLAISFFVGMHWIF